jgi:type IV pilus assembly protein PilA
MLRKLRTRVQDEKGFTLIELLVVILIIGILAAIALPAFLNQRAKAQDTEAKTAARTAQTAEETYYTDNQKYTGTKADLVAIEPALGSGVAAAGLSAALGADDQSYTVDVTQAKTGTKFTVTKNNAGVVTRTCTGTTSSSGVGKNGCATNGSW